MRITRKWLKEHNACVEGMAWFVERRGSCEHKEIIAALSQSGHPAWAGWLVQMLGKVETETLTVRSGTHACIYYAGDVRIEKEAHVEGDICAGGDICADGDLCAEGDICADGNVRADGDISAGGEIDADGDIRAEGYICAGGDISARRGISARKGTGFILNYH